VSKGPFDPVALQASEDLIANQQKASTSKPKRERLGGHFIRVSFLGCDLGSAWEALVPGNVLRTRLLTQRGRTKNAAATDSMSALARG
jgi:hypothetical protein